MAKRQGIIVSCLLAAVLWPCFVQAQARIGIKGGVNFADMTYEPKNETEGTPDANSMRGSSWTCPWCRAWPCSPA